MIVRQIYSIDEVDPRAKKWGLWLPPENTEEDIGILEASEDDEILGYAGVVYDPELPDPYTTIVINPSHRGKGLARELYKKMLDYFDIDRAIAYVDPSNETSLKTHLKLGKYKESPRHGSTKHVFLITPETLDGK
jgi:RimJ/RimL family protein N-acetyltransferase